MIASYVFIPVVAVGYQRPAPLRNHLAAQRTHASRHLWPSWPLI